MRSRRLVAALVTLVVVGGLFYMAAPYARAASFIVRAAKLGGRMESFARDRAYTVTKAPRHVVTTRYGDVAAQMYTPSTTIRALFDCWMERFPRKTILAPLPGPPDPCVMTALATLP